MYKKKDSKKEFPEMWIIHNLKKYGNCLISKKKVEQTGGKKQLLRTLKSFGFECEMSELVDDDISKNNQQCFIIDEIR